MGTYISIVLEELVLKSKKPSKEDCFDVPAFPEQLV